MKLGIRMRIDGLMLNAISKQIDTAFDEKDESTLQKSIDEINQLLIDEKINSISEFWQFGDNSQS